MTKRTVMFAAGALLVAAVLAWVVFGMAFGFSPRGDDSRLFLLIPDEAKTSDPHIAMWMDAADEEGLHIVPVHDSDFVRPIFPRSHCAGLILPDSVHTRANDLVLSAIRQYVASGGKLFLIYDAATLTEAGAYAPSKSRLSDLAGVDYAFYDSLRDQSIRWNSLGGSVSTLDMLGIPPGKYYPLTDPPKPPDAGKASPVPVSTGEVQLKRYLYGTLEYPSFVTSHDYAGQVLLRSPAGIVAGIHSYGKGSVLFVNLPLGYLKGNSDGLLLHSFLKYFAEHTLGLPFLMPVPDGIGGIVLNWHVDSNAAIKPMQQINSWSLLQQGPYSIHVTAGPDMANIGDGLGFHVSDNPVGQALLKKYQALGYQIGSHGGWIHNYFAFHIEQSDPKEMEPFLEWNKAALEKVTGQPVVEYSAPNGNHPQWVTNWLEAHGFVAYYFTGDTGMGPTLAYRDQKRSGNKIWAFPILHLDRAAGFEEMSAEDFPVEEVGRWLDRVTDFVSSHGQVRLIYFHPPGILDYHQVIEGWLQKTAEMKEQGIFRWYTMAQIANFLNSRKQVKWTYTAQNGMARIRASHPEDLNHLTWRFPADRFAQPSVLSGAASVQREDNSWIVIAGTGKEVAFEARILTQ